MRGAPKRREPRNNLRVLRAARGWSQLLTSIKTGISENRYWRIEGRWTIPTDAERTALAKAFKVSIAEMFPAYADEQVSA